MVGAVEDLSLLLAHQPNDKIERELARPASICRPTTLPVSVKNNWDPLLDYFVQCLKDRKAEIGIQGENAPWATMTWPIDRVSMSGGSTRTAPLHVI